MMSAERVDELGMDEMRNRASNMVLAKGWKPGDRVHLFGVRELMVAFALDLIEKPVTDRCGHPDCGCDADAVCGDAIAEDANHTLKTPQNPPPPSHGES